MEENKQNYRSPIIRDVPEKDERLIDIGMLHYESSVAGYNERYHRGETSHTIHVWWARRPHSAMRSLIFASLCKDKSDEATAMMAKLAMSCDDEIVNSASELLKSQYKSMPRVLDMFGGGGTIPFEAKRLGLDSYSIDANQLSVFIQRCNMLYADSIDLKQAQKKIEVIGKEILGNLKSRTDWLYPLRSKCNEDVFGYVWTYRITCPYCGYKSILSKRPWLSKKKNRRVGFSPLIDETNGIETLQVRDLSETEEPFSPHWERHTGIYHCPNCNQVIKDINVLECEDVMTALIKSRVGAGKEFANADQKKAIPDKAKIAKEERNLLGKLNIKLPESELPVWSGIVNPALYGIRTHADFLNRRQRLVLLYLIDELTTRYSLLEKEDRDMAKFVIGALSSLIDQVVDWNCRLSMWISQNEQVGRGFCGPGIAMLFDYAETDQVLDGPANLWDKLKRICKGVKSFENCKGNITIKHAHAQQLPFDNNFFDAIVTDPPYYDNIYYSILADFFYVWKKPLLQKIEPELFASRITDYNYELVASSRRVEEGQSAHEEYCKQLGLAFSEAARVLKDDGVFSFVYSHSSVNGWEAVIRAYRQSEFFVSSVQPLSIERKGRPRAVLSQAVNTCVTIVARKSQDKKEPISLDEILNKTQSYIDEFGTQLIDASGWSQPDTGLAVIACVVGLLANSSEITNAISDIDALIAASKIVKTAFPEFSIKIRDSL
jgi:putative DNA methylase